MFSSDAKIVAVCGATGQQGGATVEALLKQDSKYKIRALTRNPRSRKSMELADQGVHVIQADFDDPSSLRAAFEGCDSVFAVTDFWKACGMDAAKELLQGKNLVDAAKASRVKHFIFSSLEDTRRIIGDEAEVKPISGRNSKYIVPHFDAKAEIDSYLWEQLPGRWTSILPSIFLENLLPGGSMAPIKQPYSSFVFSMPKNGYHMSWCSTEDIGKVAAAVIAAGPGKYAGQLIGVAGAYATCTDVADAIAKVSGKEVKALTPSIDEWINMLIEAGMPEEAAIDLGNMFVYYTKGNKGFLGLRPLHGNAEVITQTLEEWLEKNKQRFVEGMT